MDICGDSIYLPQVVLFLFYIDEETKGQKGAFPLSGVHTTIIQSPRWLPYIRKKILYLKIYINTKNWYENENVMRSLLIIDGLPDVLQKDIQNKVWAVQKYLQGP